MLIQLAPGEMAITSNALRQERPEPVLTGRAPNMQGKRIGALVVLFRCMGPRETNAFWLCECDCGRLAVRSGTALRQNVSSEACCNVCLGELQRGRAINRRPDRHSTFLKMWLEYGMLYSLWHDERITNENIQESELESPPLPKEHFIPLPEERPDVGHGGYIYPIADHEWECINCGKVFSEGFGCTMCIEPICSDCVDQHANGTLEAIGNYFGVSRERIRQCESKALRKLRHPSRSKILKPFIDERFEINEIRIVVSMAAEKRGHHCGQSLACATNGILYCARCGATDRVAKDPRYQAPSASLYKQQRNQKTVWQESHDEYTKRKLQWLETLERSTVVPDEPEVENVSHDWELRRSGGGYLNHYRCRSCRQHAYDNSTPEPGTCLGPQDEP